MKYWMRTLLFVLGGAAAGLLYYRFFGCTTGCPITSNPWMTVGYFSLLGAVLSPLWGPGKKKAEGGEEKAE